MPMIFVERDNLDRARAALESWVFDHPDARIVRMTIIHQPCGAVRIEAQYTEETRA